MEGMMIFLSPNIKKNIKNIAKYFDRLTSYRLIIAFKALMDGYDWYPAYRFLQTVKSYDLNDVVDVEQRKKQKKSVQKYLYIKKKSISQFLTEINCKDFDNIEIEKIEAEKEKCIELLTNVPFQQTLWLSEYLKFFGDLRVSDFLRRQSLVSLLNEQDKTTIILPRSLQASIELNKFENVIKILHKAQITLNKDKIEKCKKFALMRLGFNKRIERINGRHFSKADYLFDEFVYGKRIAIVGPAIPETPVANEINSFDIVIRTNFPIGNSLPSEIYGRDPDISYNMINPLQPSQHIDLSSFSNSDTLKFTIFTNEHIVKKYQKIAKNSKVIPRKNFDCAGIFWSGFPMAVQRIVYDLLHFSPSRIKIFCVNFYSTKILVHNKYSGSNNPIRSHKNSRCHDLLSNFIFCQSLFEKGLISGDKGVTDILSLNRIDYSELVNKIVGNVRLDTNTAFENEKF